MEGGFFFLLFRSKTAVVSSKTQQVATVRGTGGEKCHRRNQIKEEQHGCPLNIGRGHRFLALVSTLAPPVMHIPSSRPLAVSQLPYVAETTDHDRELSILRLDADVQDLRDQHHADLVVMVGDLPLICGLA